MNIGVTYKQICALQSGSSITSITTIPCCRLENATQPPKIAMPAQYLMPESCDPNAPSHSHAMYDIPRVLHLTDARVICRPQPRSV